LPDHVRTMARLPEDPLRLMSLIGALCSDLGAHEQALAIFQHLALLRDNDPSALVSLALAQSRSGSQTSAMATLKLALGQQPDHDMARVMLAIHLHEAGDPASKPLLRAVLTDAQDPDALSMAASVKEEILGAPVTLPAPTRHRYTRVHAD